MESLKQAKDPHIRTIRIAQGTRGVVLAPDSGDTFVLLRVMPHDKAIAWAIKQRASINTVTRAVEIRDIAMLDELTPAYERIAAAPDERLFAKVSDGDLAALGIDETTLRQARVLTSNEQLEAFAPYFPQDQREVLEYLAEGFTVEEVWRDLVSVNLPTSASDPVDTTDYATAIRHTRTRIALVTASDELRDILEPVRRLAGLSPSLPAQGRLPSQLLRPGAGDRRPRQDRRRPAPCQAPAEVPARR